MDPLSSLHFAVSPELRAAGTPKASDIAAPKAISAAELETLGGTGSTSATGTTAPPTSSFESTLGNLVSEVNGKQVAANQAVAGLMSGQNVSMNQAMISMQEANISFQLMIEVRNKLLDSYQELMRMQV